MSQEIFVSRTPSAPHQREPPQHDVREHLNEYLERNVRSNITFLRLPAFSDRVFAASLLDSIPMRELNLTSRHSP